MFSFSYYVVKNEKQLKKEKSNSVHKIKSCMGKRIYKCYSVCWLGYERIKTYVKQIRQNFNVVYAMNS